MAYIPIDVNSAVTKECTRRNYSPRTIKTYLFCINRFLKWAKKDLGKISKKDVRLFLEHLSERELAGNTMNTYHMAIKFLFEDVLDKKIWINIRYSKVPERVPTFLTKEEIKKLFGAIKNDKHRLMIQLMYSAGLRVSELVNLTKEDLVLDKNFGWVRRGKGNKDRLFIISEKLKPLLAELTNNTNYVFTSNRKGKYSVRSLEAILKKAGKLVGKRVTPHTLRHSFATHLIEDGYSVAEVQALLGHKSPETTFVYLHTASPTLLKIRSPFDQL